MTLIIKKVTLVIIVTLLSTAIFSQANSDNLKPEHKIIFQLTSNDTIVHKQLIKQFNNILSVSPSTKIELVCHGAGLDMLIVGKTIVEDKMKLLADKGVVFNACDFSIKERKIDRSKISSVSGFVPAGIIEIVTKQEQGWSYIKAGN
jgi:intracellular sulfur oxidation DsrE/DsrF family protein